MKFLTILFVVMTVDASKILKYIKSRKDILYDPEVQYAINNSLVFFDSQWMEYRIKSANKTLYESPVTECFKSELDGAVTYTMNHGFGNNGHNEFAVIGQWLRATLKINSVIDMSKSWGLSSSIECPFKAMSEVQVAVVRESYEYEYEIKWLKNGWKREGKSAMAGYAMLQCRDWCSNS
ncbi:hypothetical protein DIURU_004204 [Diutina rugosa]|uniref:Uncharacterized protein n=1 Tax=Diutina rugosa TaxID=5481 RepID=A0A642UI77_DIURU|nr:uncharacterized protein DIURU_004204 [Diutina rugosa]KAA8899537.1 hypothetical protein DIURU_004204 [Diutina rugosa]